MKLTLETKEVREMASKFKFRTPTKREIEEFSKIPPSELEQDIVKRADQDGPLTFREAMIFCLGLLTYQLWSVKCPGEEDEFLETTEEVQEYCEELKAREGGAPEGVKVLSPAPEVFAGRIQMPGSLQIGFDFTYPVPWLKGGDPS